MARILSIDAGTTGVTCLIFDEQQQVVGRAYAEFDQIYPRPGWVEHDATQIWETTRRLIREALKDAGDNAEDLVAIGITNQRETTVVWERASGKPIHNAIVWQDRRTEERCAGLKRMAKDIRRKTGLVNDAYFSATKLEWILENVEGASARAEAGELAFGTIDSWILWNLTGGRQRDGSGAVHATDVTNASRTMLWNTGTGKWDPELMATFHVPPGILPSVRPSVFKFGTSTHDAVGAEVPIHGIAGDQQAALFGQRCFGPGEAKNTYGTGCFLLQHTGQDPVLSKHGLLTTRAAQVDDTPQFALEGSVFVGGAAVQWLRDELDLIKVAPEADKLAMSVDDSGGAVVVPSFQGLGAPYWADARGAVLGISRATTKGHLARAVLEGIAHQCVDVIEAMEKDSGRKIKVLRVDGGATRSDPLMQAQADLLQRHIERPSEVEATGLGAALLAGIGVGLWDQGSLTRGAKGDRYKPKMSKADAKAARKRWAKAVKVVKAFGV